MTSEEFRSAARADLKGHWVEAAMLTFVYMLVIILGSNLLSPLLDMIYTGMSALASLIFLPLGWGFAVTFLNLQRKEENAINFSTLFSGYKDFSRIFTTMFLTQIYTLLWMLLLIIPGIIKQYSYAMTPYILLDNPEMKNNAAIELSMKMMDGHKIDLFILQLTFIGWLLLSILTLGIGTLWVIPYMQSAQANFYVHVKEDYIRRYALA